MTFDVSEIVVSLRKTRIHSVMMSSLANSTTSRPSIVGTRVLWLLAKAILTIDESGSMRIKSTTRMSHSPSLCGDAGAVPFN